MFFCFFFPQILTHNESFDNVEKESTHFQASVF